jgi:hypothetical protein
VSGWLVLLFFWLIHWFGRLGGQSVDWFIVCLVVWLVGFVGFMVSLLVGWLVSLSVYRLVGCFCWFFFVGSSVWFFGWFVIGLVYWVGGWLVGGSVSQAVGWLVGWLVSRVVGLLVGWLVVWFSGCSASQHTFEASKEGSGVVSVKIIQPVLNNCSFCYSQPDCFGRFPNLIHVGFFCRPDKMSRLTVVPGWVKIKFERITELPDSM